MLISLFGFVLTKDFFLLKRNGYVFDTQIQLKHCVPEKNIYCVKLEKYDYNEFVPREVKTCMIEKMKRDESFYLKTFVDQDDILEIYNGGSCKFMNIKCKTYESDIFDHEFVEMPCNFEQQENEDFVLKTGTETVLRQFFLKEFQNLVNTFSFKKSLECLKFKDNKFKKEINLLKQTVVNYKACRDENARIQHLNNCVSTYMDHIKKQSYTGNSLAVFEAYKEFKAEITHQVFPCTGMGKTNICMNLLEPKTIKLRKSIALRIKDLYTIDNKNIEVKAFNGQDQEIIKVNCYIGDKQIIIPLDSVANDDIKYIVVFHTIEDGTVLESEYLYFNYKKEYSNFQRK